MATALPTHNAKERPRAFHSPYRRRRIIWSAIILTTLGLFFFAPSSFWEHERVSALKDMGDSWVPSALKNQPADSWTELSGLLHMVASTELRIPSNVDPSKPLPRSVYDVDWEASTNTFKPADADPPVIVFSKSYCPFSKKAKELLETYDLSPPPKIIEVDLREDSDNMKILLTRLTRHSTFPNVFVQGKSLGGFDDLQSLHTKGDLLTTLQDAGVSVQGDVASG